MSSLYVIIKERCSLCGLCTDMCPSEAISQDDCYRIDPDCCIFCGLCRDVCPSDAIEITRD
ncbi:MAG: 4Fe-4S binding protein [Syntrophomonadaceae bacterium]